MDYEAIRLCLRRLKFSTHAKDAMLSEEFGVIYPKEVRQALQSGGSSFAGGEGSEMRIVWRTSTITAGYGGNRHRH